MGTTINILNISNYILLLNHKKNKEGYPTLKKRDLAKIILLKVNKTIKEIDLLAVANRLRLVHNFKITGDRFKVEKWDSNSSSITDFRKHFSNN